MKKLIFLLIIMCVNMGTNAQQKFSSVSGLLEYLQKSENLFDDFHRGRIEIEDRKFDYKSAYYNDSLKSILLNLLNDSIGWANYFAETDGDFVKNKLEDSHEFYIKSYLMKMNNHYMDSVLCSEIKHSYLDSAIAFEVSNRFTFYMNNIPNYIPVSLINLIGDIKYSEAYPILLSYFDKTETSRKSKDYYKVLLYRYHSPRFTSFFVKNCNVLDFDDMEIRNYILQPNTVSVSLFLNLLDRVGEVDDDWGNKIPLNVYLLKKCDYLYPLYYEPKMYEFKGKKALDRIVQMYGKKSMLKISETIIKNIAELKLFFLDLYDYYIQQELYWKQNMPYYKQEQDSLNNN